jgi:excisionase family DNA binding protein
VTRAATSPHRRIPTLEELREGPPTVDVATSCALIGVSRSYGYELLERGEFPCRAIRVGSRWRVPKTALLELLGV